MSSSCVESSSPSSDEFFSMDVRFFATSCNGFNACLTTVASEFRRNNLLNLLNGDGLGDGEETAALARTGSAGGCPSSTDGFLVGSGPLPTVLLRRRLVSTLAFDAAESLFKMPSITADMRAESVPDTLVRLPLVVLPLVRPLPLAGDMVVLDDSECGDRLPEVGDSPSIGVEKPRWRTLFPTRDEDRNPRAGLVALLRVGESASKIEFRFPGVPSLLPLPPLASISSKYCRSAGVKNSNLERNRQ